MGAGALEIEITPEMIEAGIAALASYDPRTMLEEEAVERIYRAMISAIHPL